MTELRTANLRFTQEEAQTYLKSEIGMDLPDRVITDLLSFTEGWITGLKLAAISVRERAMRMVHSGSVGVFRVCPIIVQPEEDNCTMFVHAQCV